ncbi:glycosyltransferase family 4 protein [Adlercreutzia sp. ZJ141]|uniref:glycosyltransferase family 4 protein n=1 Tax=Adlercreutzia sp. ZJ141 TaxID=2709406 RepID=UPI0013EC631A|nr:glycosyltransferase family 4 protein [Adlercreutzia sp. ZJ141]
MKVLQVCSYYSSPLYKLLFDKLHEKGIEQDVFYFAVRGTNYTAASPNVRFSECYGQLDRVFYKHKQHKVMRAFCELFSEEKYDVVHAHSLFANGYVAYEIKKEIGTPYIVAVRNSDVNEFFAMRPWLRRCGLEIMENANAVVFISEPYRQRVLRDFVPASKKASIESKSLVIPNGINELFLANSPVESRRNDGTMRLVQVGDISKNKNQLGTMKACHNLRERGYDVRLRIIGKVKDRKVFQKLTRCSFVDLYPPMSQKNLIAEYRMADVFVMPSHHETFGLSYVEAMSQGLPVVYTKDQGFDGQFRNGEVGYAVNSSDFKGIADAILLASAMSAQKRSTITQYARIFRWCDIARRYVALYCDSIG